ncbi:MAG: hypothetical protein EO766_17500 [Hydrotalea sp. AMD]|uniref:hypothetical protein n=1 Tax=Hydrotalea sp. AMD TaxID=2501297 RepID=UPI0010284E4F|nr:hypothetical protein [Hydrotalea sp. AMD]RWZ83857.1 MAG: hypothetical protein EO766_17500 [Hydrotalea sp. AMD]
MEILEMKLLSVSDLSARWSYTRAGIHKLIKGEDFPPPAAEIGRKKQKVYSEESIRHYEENKPWLFDENEKQRRQRLFLLLRTRKEETKGTQGLLEKLLERWARSWVGKS